MHMGHVPSSNILTVRASVFLSSRICFSILAFCWWETLSSASIFDGLQPILVPEYQGARQGGLGDGIRTRAADWAGTTKAGSGEGTLQNVSCWPGEVHSVVWSHEIAEAVPVVQVQVSPT
jgi:hypothetical protein